MQVRAAEKKILPAVKVLTAYMHNTTPEAPKNDFRGYCVPAGTFDDAHGIKWQLQVRAVCTKKHFVKDEQVTPIIRKNAWLFKARLFLSELVNKIFND